MSCGCGKPKCDGHCGVSPAVLQINNPSECVLFHRVEVPASMGDSKTNPPKSGAYKNVLLYYEADQTSWLYSSDGIPQKLVNGLTDYEDAINLPQINGHTLLGNQSSSDLGLQGELTAGANIQINDNVISATNTTYTAGNGIELDDTEIKAKIGDGLEFSNNGEINIANIEQYAHFFDTVADMKASTLNVGDYVATQGFYSAGDGGGANYQIVSSSGITVDGARYITLDNGLVAKLLIVGEANVKQFGATGDGTTDDTNAIKSAIWYSNSIFMPIGRYLVTDTISFENKNLRGAQVAYTSLKGLMEDKTKPVLAIGGMSNVESLTVSIDTSSLTGTVNTTNNIGILLHGGYRNLALQNGSLRNVQVENCYNGITDGGSSVFSCVFDNIRIQNFYCRGMSMTGGARTGNVYNNIYITNHGFIESGHADTVTAWNGFYMSGEESECTISQLNVEHMTANEPIYMENVHGLAATSIHLEGVRNRTDYHGFVCLSKVYGVIDAISFYFTRHRTGQSLIWLGAANGTDTEHDLFGGAKQLTINLLECKGLNRPDRATYGYGPEYPVTDSTLVSDSITGFNFITRESANDKYNVELVSHNWQTYNYVNDDSSVYKAFPKNPHGSIRWLKCGTKPLFGTTNERPTEMLFYGLTYFDTTLNKQITYYNNKWYDANGAQA